MVGQITANSFMKREFGAKLIESYFRDRVELTEVIDTSGAYIPGHGTPTVILVGKRREGSGRRSAIRTVRSVQGEPSAPARGEDGVVWRAIVEQIDRPGSLSQWVSVDDLDRNRYFAKKPWILTDGGLELVESMSASAVAPLRSKIVRIGFYGDTHADDALTFPARIMKVRRAEKSFIKPIGVGDEVRDFVIAEGNSVIHPYSVSREITPLASMPNIEVLLWPNRTELGSRSNFRGAHTSLKVARGGNGISSPRMLVLTLGH